MNKRNITPKKITSTELKPVIEEPRKEFVSMIEKKLYFMRLNLTEKTALNIEFNDGKEIEEVSIEGEAFNRNNNSLIDTLDAQTWSDIVEYSDEEFEKDIEMLKKIREEVRKHIDV